MICAACNEPTDTEPCAACGESPLLDGRWRLEKVLGRGATGTTWKALAVADGRAVAVKELPLWRVADEKHRQLAAREARVLREIAHPQIPRYYADLVAGKGKSRALYVVQEHVDGPDLAQEMERHRYDAGEVLAILDDVLGILEYLHTLSPPVVHRDVKPKNVMRRPDGRLVLVDFGSVRDALQTEIGGSTVAGTFGYMAPEQFAGEASPATDLYGAGALAVALLTRKEPHTLLDHARRLAWEPHARVIPSFAALLNDLLAVEAPRRPASARAARERIRAIQMAMRSGAEPPPIAITGGWPRPAPTATGNSGPFALGAIVAERQRRLDAELPQLPVIASRHPPDRRARPNLTEGAKMAIVLSAVLFGGVVLYAVLTGALLVGVALAPMPPPPPVLVAPPPLVAPPTPAPLPPLPPAPPESPQE